MAVQCLVVGMGTLGLFSRYPQHTGAPPLGTVSAGRPRVGWSYGNGLNPI